MAGVMNVADALACGDLVDAAYAMYESNKASLTPVPRLPPGYDFVAWIQMNDFFPNAKTSTPSFYGFLARATATPTQFFVALRGTETPMEWFDDADIVSVPFARVPTAGRVAQGFAAIYDTITVVEHDPALHGAAPATAAAAAVRAPFAAAIERLVTAAVPANATVTVTAHSLGSALATLYVIDSTANHTLKIASVYTFASPLVGNASFAARFDALGLVSWRIANAADVVPKLPPPLFGYVHVDTLYPVDSTGYVLSSLSCAHAMATYLYLLDPARPIGAACTPRDVDAAQLVASASGALGGGT